MEDNIRAAHMCMMTAIGGLMGAILIAAIKWLGAPPAAALAFELLFVLFFVCLAWFFEDCERLKNGKPLLHRVFLEWEERHEVIFHIRTIFLASLGLMIFFGVIWAAMPAPLKGGVHEAFMVTEDLSVFFGAAFILNVALVWIVEGPRYDGFKYLLYRFW